MTVTSSAPAGCGASWIAVDHAGRRQEQGDHDQDRHDRPGQLDLRAPVHLRRLAIGAASPGAELHDRVSQEGRDDDEDHPGDGEHEHGQVEDRLRRRGRGREDAGDKRARVRKASHPRVRGNPRASTPEPSAPAVRRDRGSTVDACANHAHGWSSRVRKRHSQLAALTLAVARPCYTAIAVSTRAPIAGRATSIAT